MKKLMAIGAALGAGLFGLSAPAHAASRTADEANASAAARRAPALRSLVAYVRDGNVYVSKGAAEKRLTTGGGISRPRWSPDGKQIAYVRGGRLWVMGSDGRKPRRLTTRPAAGPSWSPDGKWLAFASLSCSGGPGVFRVKASGGVPEVLFPRDCRGEPLPEEAALPAAPTGTLPERLRTDDAVAWSPDGQQIAFRGGDCESVFDSCLTIGAVKSGTEVTVAAWGGGGRQNRGFAVVPQWRPDGTRLAFTSWQEGETINEYEPVHVVEYDVRTHRKRTVGGVLDREMAYLDATHGVVTGPNGGGSWVLVVGLSDGSRRPLHSGSQPSVQPVR